MNSTKICTRCGEVKPIDQFCKHPQQRDGRQSRCKPCQNAASRIANQRKREAMRAFLDAYRERMAAPADEAAP